MAAMDALVSADDHLLPFPAAFSGCLFRLPFPAAFSGHLFPGERGEV
jgi:hypothetical protein